MLAGIIAHVHPVDDGAGRRVTSGLVISARFYFHPFAKVGQVAKIFRVNYFERPLISCLKLNLEMAVVVWSGSN